MSKSVFFEGEWVTLSRKGASPTNHCWCQKTSFVWYQNIRSALFGDGQTDRRTDGQTELRQLIPR